LIKHGAALYQPILRTVSIVNNGGNDFRNDDNGQEQVADDTKRRDEIAFMRA
jgi:hypothetical protein